MESGSAVPGESCVAEKAALPSRSTPTYLDAGRNEGDGVPVAVAVDEQVLVALGVRVPLGDAVPVFVGVLVRVLLRVLVPVCDDDDVPVLDAVLVELGVAVPV